MMMVYHIFVQILPGIRAAVSADLFRCALSNHLTAVITAVGTQVDDPVRDFDDIHVVLNDQNGVSAFHQRLKDLDQFVNVSGMQTDRRLIQHIERSAGGDAGELLASLTR